MADNNDKKSNDGKGQVWKGRAQEWGVSPDRKTPAPNPPKQTRNNSGVGNMNTKKKD